MHYLDDYFTLGAAGTNICATRLEAIHEAAQQVGIPLSPEKCEGPTTRTTFLGIELDSVEMSARLPADNLADLIAHKRVEILCDNTTVVSVIMSGTSKNEQLIHLLRELYLVSTRSNFKVTATHLPGRTNLLADALSRFQMNEFFKLAPHAKPSPQPVSRELLARPTVQT